MTYGIHSSDENVAMGVSKVSTIWNPFGMAKHVPHAPKEDFQKKVKILSFLKKGD